MTRKAYQPPHVHQYGPIGDHTFNTPGGERLTRTATSTISVSSLQTPPPKARRGWASESALSPSFPRVGEGRAGENRERTWTRARSRLSGPDSRPARRRSMADPADRAAPCVLHEMVVFPARAEDKRPEGERAQTSDQDNQTSHVVASGSKDGCFFLDQHVLPECIAASSKRSPQNP